MTEIALLLEDSRDLLTMLEVEDDPDEVVIAEDTPAFDLMGNPVTIEAGRYQRTNATACGTRIYTQFKAPQ